MAEKYRIRPKVTIHISDTKELTLHRTMPYIDECKILISNMVKQVFRDYCNFYNSRSIVGMEIFCEAQSFIYDPDYFVCWDNKERNLQDFLDILDIDIDWFRHKVEEKRLEKSVRKKTSRNKQKEEEEDVAKDLFVKTINRNH